MLVNFYCNEKDREANKVLCALLFYFVKEKYHIVKVFFLYTNYSYIINVVSIYVTDIKINILENVKQPHVSIYCEIIDCVVTI